MEIQIIEVLLYVHSYVASFLHPSTVAKWLACIAMPWLDIDLKEVVFLKSDGYWFINKEAT